MKNRTMTNELKLAIHVHRNQATWLAYEKWAERLEKAASNRVRIEIVHSGIVGIEEWNMLKSGRSDIARVFTLNMPPFPMHTVPALPYMLPDSQSSLIILDSLYKKYLFREWQEAKVLWLGLMSPWHLHTANKPVNTIDDFKGLRVQASGLMAELVKTWGGIPIEVSSSAGAARSSIQEAQYNALKNGIVDGSMGTFEVVNDFKLYEVTKYHTYLNVFRDVNATVMNLSKWNSLPDDIKQQFESLNSQAQIELNIAQTAEAEKPQKLLKELGHIMIKPDPVEYERFVQTAGIMAKKEIARLDSAGIPASEIYTEIKRLRGEIG